MKRLIIIAFLIGNIHLFAQDCIPNPENFAKELGDCIKNNLSQCIQNKIITWDDIQPIYTYMIEDEGSGNDDSGNLKKEMLQSIKKANDNRDTLIARLTRHGIDLSNYSVETESFRMTNGGERLPDGYFMAEQSLNFIFGDSAVKIECMLVCLKKEWKVVQFSRNYIVFYKGNFVKDSYDDDITVTTEYPRALVKDSVLLEHLDTAFLSDVAKFTNPEVKKAAADYLAFMKDEINLYHNLDYDMASDSDRSKMHR